MEKHNTVHAIFASGAKAAEIVDDVWQYDFGQTLQIEGLSLPPTIEVHYANKGRDTAIPQVGVTKDEITTAPIPNEILSEKGAFTAYIFVTDGKSGETCYTITGYINKRPALKEFDTPEEQEIFHAAVGAVNAAAERAESAETKATEAANQTVKDAKQTAADRAEVERLVESVSGIGEQVTKVENLTKQAQTSATNAALSEQAAKTAETNAQTAQAGAETAEGNAELAERNVKASEQAVEKAKQLVTQMGQEVLDNKNHVDQTVQAFNQTAQKAVADVNNAGQTQTERVQSAGNDAVESVKTAQTAATKAIETAKTEAVNALQAEGTTQTGNVTAEGRKQVQAVQAAAQEIVADREQIAQNKADIAEIKEEMDNLSPAIVDTATGEAIAVEDSSGNKFKSLNVYGKSEQVQTTGVQLFNVDAGSSGWIKPETGEFMESISNYVSGFIPVKNNTQYYCNFDISPYVYSYDAEKHFLRKETYNGNFITNSDVFFIRFAISSDKEIALSKAKKIMLCEGSTAKPYEPYTGGKPSPSVEYPQEIVGTGDKGNIGVDVFGGNLFDIDAEPFEGHRNDYIFENNAIYKENVAPFKPIRYHIKTPPKTRLRLSTDVISNTTVVQVSNYKEDGTAVDVKVGKPDHEKFFDTNEHEKLVVSIYNYEEGMLKAGNIMVGIAGEAKNIFEPYKPAQTLTIPTLNGLPGIKVDSGGNYTDTSGQQWVCDEIDLERGKYVQRVSSEIITGEFVDNGGISNEVYKARRALRNSNINGTHNIISNMFVNTNILTEGITQGYGQIYLKLFVDRLKGESSTIDDVNVFVKEHPFKVVYELKNPIEHDLPPEVIEAYKKLHTNYPVTTVLNDAGAGMKVEYVADTKNYTDNKIAESVKNQMQNLTNLLSLMPMETQAAMIENDVNRILESEVTK